MIAAEANLAGRGRLVIRASGTEPVIRVMAEGDDAGQVETLVDRICDAVRAAALMLAMNPPGERCATDLPAPAPGAFICSFECTFCAECADDLDERCPNCAGELVDSPTRVARR